MPGGRRPSIGGGEGGAVTAELSLGIPVLMVVTVALVWLLALGVAQVRAIDAAREVARGVARGDAPATAELAGRRIAPPGAGIDVVVDSDVVRVTVTAEVGPPGGSLLSLPVATLCAEAVAALEPSVSQAVP